MEFTNGVLALPAHWARTCSALGLGDADARSAVFRDLRQRYAEPQRHYHDLRHLVTCLDALGELRAEVARPDECAMALWFHDAVYWPGRHDNEERSAELAGLQLERLGLPAAAVTRVKGLVLATATHVPAAGMPADAGVVIDADLAILGADAAPAYRAYSAAIRLEYAHVADSDYRKGRAGVLRRFLQNEWIFNTGAYRRRREARARENLRMELDWLKAG